MEETKRVYNPVTQKYYEVKKRTTGRSSKGQIKSLWSSKKKNKRKSNK